MKQRDVHCLEQQDEQNLIAPQSAPDNTAVIAGAAVLVTALVVITTVAVVLHRKKRVA
jgi:hypothetical protein